MAALVPTAGELHQHTSVCGCHLHAQWHAMKIPRRQFLHLAVCPVAVSAVSRIARAQIYPSRPVRIILVPLLVEGMTLLHA
jgi:hypothetical protein